MNFFLNIERGEGSIKCHGGTDYYNLTIIAKKVTGAVKVVRSNDKPFKNAPSVF
jgi:hypothetical protein